MKLPEPDQEGVRLAAWATGNRSTEAWPSAGSPGLLRPVQLSARGWTCRLPVSPAGSPRCARAGVHVCAHILLPFPACHPTPAPADPPGASGGRSPRLPPRGVAGLTFLVDLVVQCDGAAAPLDGPVSLLLRARVQGDALPLAFDAAF